MSQGRGAEMGREPPEPPGSGDADGALDEVIASYLDARCRGEAPSREELLARHPELASALAAFLDDDAGIRRIEPLPARAAAEGLLRTGDTLGDYRILGEIACGGMGIVYRAHQATLNRTVALKLVRGGRLASVEAIRRFQLESEVAGQLQHPGILPVYEVGEEGGMRFYSMPLIEGGSLRDRLREHAGDPRRAAVLIEKASRALHFAHERGVLHRDLKPANILLDPEGNPLLSDFGLAKRLDSDAGLTISGTIVGTAHYLAPEQAAGDRRALTIAADVYSLGAILYELLAGRPPFPGDSSLEVIERLKHELPERPSRLRPGVPRDLETICLKCLEKEPAHRYASAASLADDLDRFLRGQPILARRASLVVQARAWCRRRPAAAALLGAAFLLLGLGLGAGIWHGAQLRRALLLAHRYSYISDVNLAAEGLRRGDWALVRDCLRRTGPGQADELRSFEWHYLLGRGAVARVLREGVEGTQVLAAEAGRDRVATGSHGGAVHVWEGAMESIAASVNWSGARIRQVALVPGDGLLIAAEPVEEGVQGGLALWDLERGATRWIRRGEACDARFLAVSPDGSRIAWGESRGGIRVIDAAGDETRSLTSGFELARAGAFLGDSRTLAFADQAGRLLLAGVDGDAPPRPVTGCEAGVLAVAVSPDGALLACGGDGESVHLIDPARAAILQTLQGPAGGTRALAFAPTGDRLAAAGCRGPAGHGAELVCWRLGTHEVETRLAFEGRCLDGLAVFDPAGLFAVVESGWQLQRLDVSQATEPVAIAPGAPVSALALSRDSTRLAVGDRAGSVLLCDSRTGAEIRRWTLPATRTTALELSPDGSLVAAGAEDRVVRVFRIADGSTAIEIPGFLGTARALAFDLAGKRLAVGCYQRLSLHDLAHGTRLADVEASPDRVVGLAPLPGSEHLITCGRAGDVRLWRAQDLAPQGALERQLPSPQRASNWVNAAALSPDGKWLALAWDRGYERVDVAAGGPWTYQARPIHAGVLDVGFTADSKALALGLRDGSVQLVDPVAHRPRLALEAHAGEVIAICLSADGAVMATGSTDGLARIWRAASAGTLEMLSTRGPLAPTPGQVTELVTPAQPSRWVGVAFPGAAARPGCQVISWADVDGDADPDLLLGYSDSALLLGNAAGAFTDVTPPVLATPRDLLGAAWGDHDRDGDPDLLLAARSGPLQLLENAANAAAVGFAEASALLPGGRDGARSAAWVDHDLDGDLDVSVARPGQQDLLLEQVGGRFEDRTARHPALAGASSAHAWGDFDADGVPDLYLVRRGAASRLLRQARGAGFTDVTTPALALDHPGLSQAAARGDFDGDGRLDLFVARRGCVGAVLFNRVDGFKSSLVGPRRGSHKACAPGDFDGDGDLDLFAANDEGPSTLLENDGQGTLLAADGGLQTAVAGAYSAAAADADGDGDLDLAVALWSAAPELLRNDAPAPGRWLHLDLEGTRSNRDGVGARVLLEAGGRRQLREVAAGGGSGSQDSLLLEFGLGTAEAAESIEVRWPSGTVQQLERVPANQKIRLREP